MTSFRGRGRVRLLVEPKIPAVSAKSNLTPHKELELLRVSSVDQKCNIKDLSEKWKDLTFLMSFYKTMACVDRENCPGDHLCPKYHSAKDMRRHMHKVEYGPEICPEVHPSVNWEDRRLCCDGVECDLCHCEVEVRFHPHNFKKVLCDSMLKNAKCPRGIYCPDAHALAEKKDWASVTILPVLRSDMEILEEPKKAESGAKSMSDMSLYSSRRYYMRLCGRDNINAFELQYLYKVWKQHSNIVQHKPELLASVTKPESVQSRVDKILVEIEKYSPVLARYVRSQSVTGIEYDRHLLSEVKGHLPDVNIMQFVRSVQRVRRRMPQLEHDEQATIQAVLQRIHELTRMAHLAEEECSICSEGFEESDFKSDVTNSSKLIDCQRCKTWFHRNCLRTWCLIKRNCPYCRLDFD